MGRWTGEDPLRTVQCHLAAWRSYCLDRDLSLGTVAFTRQKRDLRVGKETKESRRIFSADTA